MSLVKRFHPRPLPPLGRGGDDGASCPLWPLHHIVGHLPSSERVNRAQPQPSSDSALTVLANRREGGREGVGGGGLVPQ